MWAASGPVKGPAWTVLIPDSHAGPMWEALQVKNTIKIRDTDDVTHAAKAKIITHDQAKQVQRPTAQPTVWFTLSIDAAALAFRNQLARALSHALGPRNIGFTDPRIKIPTSKIQKQALDRLHVTVTGHMNGVDSVDWNLLFRHGIKFQIKSTVNGTEKFHTHTAKLNRSQKGAIIDETIIKAAKIKRCCLSKADYFCLCESVAANAKVRKPPVLGNQRAEDAKRQREQALADQSDCEYQPPAIGLVIKRYIILIIAIKSHNGYLIKPLIAAWDSTLGYPGEGPVTAIKFGTSNLRGCLSDRLAWSQNCQRAKHAGIDVWAVQELGLHAGDPREESMRRAATEAGYAMYVAFATSRGGGLPCWSQTA